MPLTSAQLKGRIKSLASRNNTDARNLLRIYAMERFLERLSVSKYHDNLMKRGNLSQIPADRNHTRGSVIEKLKMLGAAEPHKNAGKADPKPFIYRKFNT